MERHKIGGDFSPFQDGSMVEPSDSQPFSVQQELIQRLLKSGSTPCRTLPIISRLQRKMVVKVGDTLPDVKVFENDADTQINLRDVFKGKKGILFAVPGAFTPGCSKTHLPGFVNDYDKLKAAGAEVIVCTSTDNAFVLKNWAEQHKAVGKVRVLADPQAKLAKGLGVDTEVPPLGLISKRYSAVIDDNKVKSFNLEGDGFGLSCSLANVILDQLKSS